MIASVKHRCWETVGRAFSISRERRHRGKIVRYTKFYDECESSLRTMYMVSSVSLHSEQIYFISSSRILLNIAFYSTAIYWQSTVLPYAPISIDETKLSLKRMKANKAAGTDGIPSEFYKHTGDILDHPLTALFNHVLNTGLYPDTWCEGLINPLHKRESPTLPDNYRKITITPAIGKLFDGILNNRLQFAKECLPMSDPFQNGFKPNSCAIDNIFLLNGIIDKCKANGRPLYTCFIDFKSAFDLINRSALLYKLLN